MYEVNRQEGNEYVDHYIYKSRNDHNQIIVCEAYRTLHNTINFKFYITTKRRDSYQAGKITGKDGIKSLIWAKKCLIDFLEFCKWKYKHNVIEVYPDDEKRRRVYEYSLIPLGFKVQKDKYKPLVYRT